MLISNLSYTHTGVPVGTTEFILIRSLYGGTRRYYRTHTYSCISDLILVLLNIYLSYRAYTYLTDLIVALPNMYLSYGSYTCITKLILVFQILFMCEGTRRYDKSKQIRLIQIHIRYGH